jgi:hypothetical protein
MFKQPQITKRSTVDVDTRRLVFGIAANRKPADVNRVNHETFIRQELKSKMGWPQRENAPESIKQAARDMAAALVRRDLEALAKAGKARLTLVKNEEPKKPVLETATEVLDSLVMD